MSSLRLKTLLETKCGDAHDKDLLDCYNQTVCKDIAYTITTRVIGSCHYFVFERVDI